MMGITHSGNPAISGLNPYCLDGFMVNHIVSIECPYKHWGVASSYS
jgi:hypothetical protein